MSPKKTTDLRPRHMAGGGEEPPPVFVDPAVSPQAAAYQAGLAARRARGAPQKYAEPVGGGPAPHIPRLDQPHREGMTMAQQAEAVNSPSQQELVQRATQPGSIVEPPLDPYAMQQAAQARANSAPKLNLQAGDMLPQQAMQDPECKQGPGSAYAAAQPQLALRYGVLRKGQHVPPQMLTNQSDGRLSPETLEGLQAMQRAQAKPPAGMPQSEVQAEREAADGAASQSARVATELTPEEKKEVDAAISAMDSFDYDGFRQRMDRDVLNNEKQRRIIRGRCKPLDIDDLIMKNRISQDVPIIPPKEGKLGFVVRYTSMTGEEDLALKQLIMQESKSVEVTDRYLLDKFAFMAIACGLAAINGNPAPPHLDEQGNFNAEKFWVKFNWVLKRPIHMLASIGVNHTWFEVDVRKLFVAEKLGNG